MTSRSTGVSITIRLARVTAIGHGHRVRRPRIDATRSSGSTRSPTTSCWPASPSSAAAPSSTRVDVRTESRRRIRQLAIRAPDETSAVATLSGGNQQKVQVARWLVADTPILILDDPTRGVDVGARAEIHEILVELAAAGRALLLVSSDAGELVALCSRILVMRGGRLVAELAAAETTEGELIEIAAGGTSEPDQEATR